MSHATNCRRHIELDSNRKIIGKKHVNRTLILFSINVIYILSKKYMPQMKLQLINCIAMGEQK